MSETTKAEQRMRLLLLLREENEQIPVEEKDQILQTLNSNKGYRLVLESILEKWIKLNDELQKAGKTDKFYEVRGQMNFIDWLLNHITENTSAKAENNE